MPITEIILGIVLAVVSLALIVAVLMQPGKDKRLSGAIAGGAFSYLVVETLLIIWFAEGIAHM